MDAPKHQNLTDQLKDKSLLKQACYFAGKWVTSDKTIDVTNPASGAVIGTIPALGKKETAEAIKAAEEAQKKWAATPAKQRGQILRKWYELMMANQEDLARIMTAEQGKPLTESRGEVA